MKQTAPQHRTMWQQCLYGIAAVGTMSAIGWATERYMGYHVIAFGLLLVVSLAAMVMDILPVLLTALVSALVWDFCFIPPRYTFHVRRTEDVIFLLMYFVVAITGAALTFRIRKMQQLVREEEERKTAIRLYDTLLNSLSHELRTPIATIIAATDNLQTQQQLPGSRHHSELIGEIAQAAVRLNEQVENLLSISRLDAGFIHAGYDWADIGELVYNVVQRAEDVGKAHKMVVNIPEDMPLVKTDAGLLQQVLYNLVSNAVRYTPVGSTVTVSATAADEQLLLSVADDGPGFPDEEIERAFEKFYRLNRTIAGGTGLGLSIVRGYAEVLGGTVTLRNQQPHGAVFEVRIVAELSYLKNLKHE